MQIGFYFDQTRCTGCSACRVACKDWNDVPAGPENWMRIKGIEKGKLPEVYVGYMVGPCFHCINPVCVPACPVKAISKRDEDGIVVVDSNTCVGNVECDEKCLKACPYNAPQFGPEKGSKMRKCNFCLDRHINNKIPACVESCPVRAFDSGFFDELRETHGSTRETVGFKYSKRADPAVVFKPKLK